MPCDSRVQIRLDLEPSRSKVLAEAMTRLGFHRQGERHAWSKSGVSVALLGGELAVVARSNQTALDVRKQILQETSRSIVNQAAQRNGWRVNWTADNRAQVVRGGTGGGLYGGS